MKLLLSFLFCLFTLDTIAQDDCQKFIRSTYDKYEGNYRFHTSKRDEKGAPNQIFFVKTVEKGVSKYYLGIEVLTNTPYFPQTDFVILFIGGKRIVRKNYTINVEVNNTEIAYKAVTAIPLTDSERLMFTKEIIDGLRIQADDYEIEVLKALQIRKELDCLIKAKIPSK